jgi:nicotinamide-nucleotide amidase
MVTVSSLCVGKELLIGKTLNTNAHWIGSRLLSVGLMLSRIATVTDSLPEIASGLAYLLSEGPDFVIVIGGLGPTPDDMTLRGVALALGRKVRSNGDALRLIKEHYAGRGLGKVELTPARRKMAVIPQGATPVLNPVGTAPAVRLESSGAVIFCLPGVPREMRAIYTRSVAPEIRARVGPLFPARATLQIEGVFESTLTPAIAEAMRDHPSAYIKSHPRGLKEGRSRIELDAVVTYPTRGLSEKERDEIVAFFTGRVAEAGGRIVGKTVR